MGSLAALAAAALAAAGLGLTSCNTPTQVSVLVTTDMACDQLKGVSVTVGLVNEVDTNAPSGTSEQCTPIKGTDRNRIGEIIVYPDDNKDDAFALKVVAGVDIGADKCTRDNDYAGCIVARRALNFVPHTMLKVPVFLSGSCEGVGCTARLNETCVLGSCVPAQITDSNTCAIETPDQTGACDEGVLTGGTNPLPEPAPVDCGRPSVITDNFDADALSTHWRKEMPVLDSLVEQAGGTLGITPPTTAMMPTEVRRRSVHAVNLDRDAITVRVAQMLDTATTARAYLAAELDQGRRMLIEQKQGKLSFLHTDEAGTLVGKTIDYDPAVHVWWEIRDTGENVVLRTSKDGKTWQLGDLFPKPSYTERVYIVLGAGADEPVAVPGTVKFDDLNQGRPAAAWCPVTMFPNDTFAGMVPSPVWEFEEQVPGSCSVMGGGGADGESVTLMNNGQGTNDCYLRSRTAFSLRGNSVTAKIESVPNALDVNGVFYVGVRADNGDKVEAQLRTVPMMGLYSYYLWSPNADPAKQDVGVAVTLPVWLKVREEEGMFYWEMSSDGTKWNPFFNYITKDIPIDAVHVTLGIQAYSAFENMTPAVVTVAEVITNPAPAP